MDSGWGIQPHWLLDRSWIFADEDERGRQQPWSVGSRPRSTSRLAKYGWTLDSTHDLTWCCAFPVR